MSDKNISDQLLALCDSMAERLSDKVRIDRFVQVGHEVATELAELDAFVAVHQYTIDANPPDLWPKDSVLAKAIARHEARMQTRAAVIPAPPSARLLVRAPHTTPSTNDKRA